MSIHMKQFWVIRLSGIFVCMFLFTSTLLFVNSVYAKNISDQEALVIEVQGIVTVQKSGSSKFIPVVTGLALSIGDIIRTGVDGNAIILFANSMRVDLFSNSQIQIKSNADSNLQSPENSVKKNSMLGKLWGSLKSKFEETEYTGTQAGRVGTLRGANNEPDPGNIKVSPSLQKILEDDISVIDREKLPRKTSDMMKAILYEQQEQYRSAELLYSGLIKNFPDDEVLYTMLIDLYLKIDLYTHAARVQKLKKLKGF